LISSVSFLDGILLRYQQTRVRSMGKKMRLIFPQKLERITR
jgi:hypothetical protein